MLLQGTPPFPFPHFRKDLRILHAIKRVGERVLPNLVLSNSVHCATPSPSVSLSKVITLKNWRSESWGVGFINQSSPWSALKYWESTVMFLVCSPMTSSLLKPVVNFQSLMTILVISSIGQSRSLLPPRRTFLSWSVGPWPLLVFPPPHCLLLC